MIRKELGVAVLLFFLIGLCMPKESFAQGMTVTGTVLSSDDGSPLQGVIVTNVITNKKTLTNAAGYYSIQVMDTSQHLRFSYVGYVTQEFSAGKENLSVKLVPSDASLDDVVITGYGQKKSKRELSYQAVTVSGEDIAQTRRTNFLNALAGRVPGLTVTSTSGLPGASASVMLRGGASIGGNNQPLFVVDGVPMDNSSVDQNNLAAPSSTAQTGSGNLAMANRNSDYTNRIADINPEDIESVTVLKGPEAAAMYGSDGASGAIVITTRRGAVGTTQMSYTNSFTLAEVYRYPQTQRVYERGTNGIYDPTAINDYGYTFFGPKYDEGTVFYDNMQNFFVKSFSQQHNLSLEAGSKTLNYRFSAGYVDQSGVVPNTRLQRYNFRFSAFAQLNKRLSLNTTFSYVSSANDKAVKGAGSFYTNLMTFMPDIDASNYVNPDGTRVVYRNVLPSSELDNPYWDVNKNRSKDNNYNLTGNINLQGTIAKDLTATAIVGMNQYSTVGYAVYNPQSRAGYSLNGFLSTYEINFNSLNGTLRFNYVNRIKNIITNTFYVGGYFEDFKKKTNSQRGERFYEQDDISINNTDPTARLAQLAETEIRKERAYAGYTFNFKDLVYLSFTGTKEGTSNLTSKFHDLQPFYNFGSASGSYILSDMPFMKPLKSWLDYAKLRASYASTGKGPIAPYIIDYSFGSVTSTGGGFALGSTLNNFELKPEKSNNLELGGEMQFLHNRLGIDVAWFNNKIKDNIISQRVSYGTGGIIRWANGGALKSSGWEIQLKGTPVKSTDFSWDVVVNFDRARTKITKLPGDLPFYYDSDTWVFGSVRSQVGVGQSLANLSGFDFNRNNNGQLLISPTTGLPTENATDYITIGDRQPDFKMGVINTLYYKDFGLSFNLDIRKGGDVFNANQEMMMINGISNRTLDRESPRVIQGVLQDGLENTDHPTPNNIAITPYYRSNYYSGAIAESDYIEKVNWLRMRDITLSYQLSKALLKRQRVFKTASVYVTATDVFMITNYSGMDPNVNALTSNNSGGYGGSGIDYGAIPNPRAINFGIKFTF